MFCGYIKSCRLEMVVYRCCCCCCLLLSMLLLWWNFTVGRNARFIFSSLTSGIVVGLQVEGFGADIFCSILVDVRWRQGEFAPPPSASRPLDRSGRFWVVCGCFDQMETIGDCNRTEPRWRICGQWCKMGWIFTLWNGFYRCIWSYPIMKLMFLHFWHWM